MIDVVEVHEPGERSRVAEALLQAVCSDPLTANFVYLALIEQPEPAP